MLLSDEIRFNLRNDSRCTLIWRDQSTRYLPSNLQEIDHGNLIASARIMLHGRTIFHIFQSENANRVR